MTIDEVRARLYHHANLPSTTVPDDSLGFLLSTAEWQDGPVDESLLATSFREVLACLTELNYAWNGPVPSETTREKTLSVLDRGIIYSVSVIISSAARYALHCASRVDAPTNETRMAMQVAYALSCAWDLVTAGDTDDLHESVRLEVMGVVSSSEANGWHLFEKG